jgi:hypothetical protein
MELLTLNGGPLDGDTLEYDGTAYRWGFYYENGEYNRTGNVMEWTENGQQG